MTNHKALVFDVRAVGFVYIKGSVTARVMQLNGCNIEAVSFLFFISEPVNTDTNSDTDFQNVVTAVVGQL